MFVIQSAADSFTPHPHTAPGVCPLTHQSAVKAISAHITITACYKTENTVPNDCQLEKRPCSPARISTYPQSQVQLMAGKRSWVVTIFVYLLIQ